MITIHRATVFTTCLLVSACVGFSNEEVPANTAHDKTIRKINGSITVREGASVKNISVNDGGVDIDDAAYVKNVKVTDGNLTAGKKVIVNGDLKVTDGNTTIGKGSKITGNVYSRFGHLRLDGVTVEGDIELFCSDATISGSTIKGDIRLEQRLLWKKCEEVKQVDIGAGSQLKSLLVAVPEIKLRVHRQANIVKLVGPEPEYYD